MCILYAQGAASSWGVRSNEARHPLYHLSLLRVVILKGPFMDDQGGSLFTPVDATPFNPKGLLVGGDFRIPRGQGHLLLAYCRVRAPLVISVNRWGRSIVDVPR